MRPLTSDTANCWDFFVCGHGPGAPATCPAASDTASDGTNRGRNAGRICWAVAGTLSGSDRLAPCAERANCLTCDFLHLVKAEEGDAFQLLKLARGVNNPQELQRTISKVESLMAIHERLRSHFDLKHTIRQVTEEAQDITGAQRSVVFLMKGRPPALLGEFALRGQPHKVVINISEESAVGFAALHNQMVNLRDIYAAPQTRGLPVFNRTFDSQCRCKTHSFLAVPICDPDDRVIGVITGANSRKGYFSSDDEWFLEKYATEIALAVEKQKFIHQTVSALRLAAIDETVAGLSHCIKNIAQALRAGSHVIKKALRSDNLRDVKTVWAILDRHIEQLANLSMDVLAYDPSLKERAREGGLNELVEHAVQLFSEEARARAIEIGFVPGDTLEQARFDPIGVYRCLVNLISNALDACPLSEGVVTVATERASEREFAISVSDNGRGMDEETRAAVFEVFQTSKPGKGAGIGLRTVADIVNRHNGRVEVESELGKGSTFRLFFREDLAVV